MYKSNTKHVITSFPGLIAIFSVLIVHVSAQVPSGASTFGKSFHIGFERPESWGLKYFASTTLRLPRADQFAYLR